MKTYHIILAFLAAMFLSGCEEDNGLFDNDRRITGTGEIKSKSVVVEDFTAVDLENVSNVYIEVGKSRKVVFIAYENIWMPMLLVTNCCFVSIKI